MSSAASYSTLPFSVYRARARRLRAAHRSDPARLQRELSRLAASPDRDRPTMRLAPSVPAAAPAAAASRRWSDSAVLGPRGGDAKRFADVVAARLADLPLLYYPERQALLREAARRGIGRFEANLIIAAVQHRLGRLPAERAATRIPDPRRRRPPVLLVVAALQGAIVLGAWWVMHGGWNVQ